MKIFRRTEDLLLEARKEISAEAPGIYDWDQATYVPPEAHLAFFDEVPGPRGDVAERLRPRWNVERIQTSPTPLQSRGPALGRGVPPA